MTTRQATRHIDAPLTDNEREMLEKLMAGIRERFGDLLIEARLFGSKARGDSDPESDIDVWLLFERELTREERQHLYELLAELDAHHGAFTQLSINTRVQWEMPAIRGSDFAFFLNREGVRI